MKKWIIASLLAANFFAMCLVGNLTAAQLEADLDFTTGYRGDDLDWNIAGDILGTNPNVLSELTWSDLKSYQIKLGAKALINKVFYLRGSFDIGWILDGDNQDSDFAGDNRTQEWSRSNNSADDGTVLDATAGLGYQFKLASGRFRLIPLVGFSYSEQNLTMMDGVQTVSEPALAPAGVTPLPLGPFAGLDSTYDTQWYGPWIGVDLLFGATEKVNLFVSFEYHWADYEAEANWNLISEFAHPKSFEHEADGTGFLITVGGEYVFAEPWWSLGLEMNYQDWSTDAGIDRVFFADGTTADTRLNEVNWDSFAIMLKVTYRFHYFYHR